VPDLIDVLTEARRLLALPSNEYSWSSWEDHAAALMELDNLVETLKSGKLPDRITFEVLFAPTGPIQEVSFSGGWTHEFLSLARKFDAAISGLY
jgi:hypothetical protein